jgi:DNA-binding NarL/FixJ family response regulator
MANVWRSFEDMPGLIAVPAGWQRCVGEDFDAFRAAFLVSTGRQAKSFPSPHVCECSLRVCRHRDGSIVAVSECGSTGCGDMQITGADVMLWGVSWKKLGRAVAQGFDCDVKDVELGVAGTRQIGSFGAAGLPVVLTIQHEEGQFGSAVRQLVGQIGAGFVLLAPTSRFMNGNSRGLLEKAGAGFFDLEGHISLTAQGSLRARKSGVELFGRFLPKDTEPVPEDVARQAFQLIEQLDSEQVIKPPSVLAVFRLYCDEGLSAEEVARRCGCSKGTVINRLRLIREKTQMEPDELRRFSSQFEKIEDDIRESKAAYIHRKGMIDDSRSWEEGE